MSVLEITPVDELDDIDMSDVPPCECYVGQPPRKPCRRPSAFRIFSVCSCGHQVTIFICASCHCIAIQGEMVCGICGLTGRGITRYC